MTQLVFSVEGVELACFDQGTGTPVVLLHGFPLDHMMWQPQIDTLSSRCRVIAPDLRGFGNSSLSSSDVSEGVEMSRYAADVITILDGLHINEPVIMGGFSMGGYVLWQVALSYPERIRGLVLCDTRAAADTTEAAQGRLGMAAEVLRSGTGPVAEAMLPKLLAPQTLAEKHAVVQQLDGMIREAAPAAIAAAQRGMARRADVRGQLASLDKPALLVVGTEDALSPPHEMSDMALAMPNANLVEINNAGHMTTLENPAAVNSALESFIDQF